ncbi:zinc-binding dehydrogenase [Oceanobacillus sp. FSL W7-1293]|uniref:quinone oxidoreductase family protein n=1 Tax=Oceanobacillus sp. FSL W7-1293 TaxID=2921699 RepID=UPI0030D16911
MKAVVMNEFGGSDVLQFKEIPKPEPQPDEILIKVIYTSVNYADIKNRNGSKAKANFPMILGLDAAGAVEKVGASIESVKPGDRVICFPKGGAYAEYVLASELLTFKIPDELDFKMAAACPTVGFLSYKLTYDLAQISKADTVLVHSSAGGVGSTIIQMAKLLGAKRIIGTVSSLEKSSVPLELGADDVYTYTDFDEKIKETTDGKGVDIIFDSQAGEITERSMEVLSHFGRLVHFGNSSGGIGNFNTKEVHASCRSVLGFSLGTTRKERPETLETVSQNVLELIVNGKIEIKIGAEYPLEKIAEAHDFISSRKSTGKILIHVSD